MEELRDQNNNFEDPQMQEEEEFELTHTDKLVGVFTEPGSTFSKMREFKPKVVDWLLPLLLFIIVLNVGQIVVKTNPTIRFNMLEKQMEAVEQTLDQYVKSGALTQEQADQQMDVIRDRMNASGISAMIPQAIGSLISMFIVFFIIVTVFFLCARFLLKGDGAYTHAMVGYGLPIYISILQMIVAVILSMIFERYIMDTSVASIIDMEKGSFGGFLLSKLDLFSIWFYSVVSIGFAKLFKSEETGKYFAIVFGLWISVSIIIFFLAKSVPFLANLM